MEFILFFHEQTLYIVVTGNGCSEDIYTCQSILVLFRCDSYILMSQTVMAIYGERETRLTLHVTLTHCHHIVFQ